MQTNFKKIAIVTSLLGVTALSALLISKHMINSKKAHATPRKRTAATAPVEAHEQRPETSEAAPASIPRSLILIGDSQTQGTLGEAYTRAFDQTDVRYFGKPGATHGDYLSDPSLKQALRGLGCADVIVIQLGDNGVSNSQSSVEGFIRLIRAQCPDALIVWAGPMKAVAPTNGSSTYVNTTDRSSSRYLPTYNETRRLWDGRLSAWLPDLGVTYFSNYYAQEAQPASSPFSDSREGDGIHLTKESAAALAEIMRDFIHFDLEA